MDSTSSTERDPGGATEPDHELVRVFAAHGFALNGTLCEMLNEHYSHRTERRGAGFTQATRHLARLVNRPRELGEQLAWPTLFASPPRADALEALRLLPAQLEREESRLLATMVADLVCPEPVSNAVSELPAWPEDLKIGTCPLAEQYFLELAETIVRHRGLANILV